MEDTKSFYEDLDAIHASLPETERERFAEVVGALSAIMASERKQMLSNTVRRWRRDRGYPDYR